MKLRTKQAVIHLVTVLIKKINLELFHKTLTEQPIDGNICTLFYLQWSLFFL